LVFRLIRALVLAPLLMFLLAADPASSASPTHAATCSAILRYATAMVSRTFREPHGELYRFRLNPERNIDGDLTNMELVMEDATRTARTRNLLYPQGNWHGYQAFFFAASDFVHGPRRSIFGRSRIVQRSSLGISVEITVEQVAVEPTRATRSTPPASKFTFKSLVLEITVRTRGSHWGASMAESVPSTTVRPANRSDGRPVFDTDEERAIGQPTCRAAPAFVSAPCFTTGVKR